MSYITTPDGVTFGTGDRIRAHAPTRFVAAPLGTYSIAGAQDKVVGNFTEALDVVGTVIHVKGNHPISPTRVWVYIEVETATPPLAKEICNTKHSGVEEHFFEYFDHIKIDVLINKTHLAEAFEAPQGQE